MTAETTLQIDVNKEIDRFFNDSSLSSGKQPEIVIITGGVAVGKTTFRKQNFATGFVVVDAVEIFLSLCQGKYFDFPGPFEEAIELIGPLIAARAIAERRNIVTEIIGAELKPTRSLVDSMIAAGYLVKLQALECDLEESIKRSENRDDDCVSAYYAEHYQREWLIAAATSRDAVSENG